MNLTRAQKKYLKKNLRRFPLAKMAADLKVPEKKILEFLKSHWRKEKYQKFIAEQKLSRSQSLLSLNRSQFGNKWFRQNWKIFAFLTFLVLTVYFNSLTNDFISDDVPGILRNKDLGTFRYISLRFPRLIRPVYYTLVYKLFGLKPVFYRLINIFFHLGSVWLTYILITCLASPSLAIITASLFAVHPILTESITWIGGGGYAQAGFFFLLSLLTYVLSQEKKKLYLPSILAFIMALSASDKAISLFLVFPLFEISFGQLRQNWKRLIPFFTISGFWILYLFGALGERITSLETTYYQDPGPINPLIQIPIAITKYLELIFWPKNLTLYHSEMVFSQGEYLLRLGGLIIFLTLVAYVYKKNKWVFFWLSFFLISLLPYLTPLKISWIVAERYVYLGTIAILALGGSIIQAIGKMVKNQKAAYTLLAIILLALSIRTMIRNADWKNQDTLWFATAKTSPSSPHNHNNLGDYYGRQGDLEKAMEEFQKAIELKPNYGDAYHNLANVYQQMGKSNLAIENYQKALSLNPNLWQTHQNLAGLYFNQKKFDLAQQELEEAIKVNPKNPDLYFILGVFYLQLGKKEKAREAFQQTLQLDPNHQQAKEQLLTLP